MKCLSKVFEDWDIQSNCLAASISAHLHLLKLQYINIYMLLYVIDIFNKVTMAIAELMNSLILFFYITTDVLNAVKYENRFFQQQF